MTTRLPLYPEGALLPTTNPATRSQVESAAAAPSEAPKLNYTRLVYADAADRFAIWNFPVPPDFVAGFAVSLTFWWGASVATNSIIWGAGIARLVASSTDLDTTAAFTIADAVPATAVPGTVGQFKKSTLALTTPAALAAGDLASVFIGRNGNAAGDTAAGAGEVYEALLEYTSIEV